MSDGYKLIPGPLPEQRYGTSGRWAELVRSFVESGEHSARVEGDDCGSGTSKGYTGLRTAISNQSLKEVVGVMSSGGSVYLYLKEQAS